MDLKARARQLKTDVPAVFLALRDPGTPVPARVLAGLTVAYALSPVDLIPDFVPVLGYLDDVLLLPLLVTLTIRAIPGEVWARSQARAAGLWADGAPKQWRCAVPIFVIWGLLLGLLVRALLN